MGISVQVITGHRMRPRPRRGQGWRKGGDPILETGFLQSRIFLSTEQRISYENGHDACGYKHTGWKFCGHFHIIVKNLNFNTTFITKKFGNPRFSKTQ